MDFTLLIVAVLPVVALFLFVYWKDKYGREPFGMLFKALLAGAFCTLPAILLESVVSGFAPPKEFPVLNGLFNGFAVAGFCEELCKLMLLALVVWRSPHFDEYFDGVVYAACVSLGFACVENLMYVFGAGEYSQALVTGSMRAVLSVPGHFLFAVVMGYYFGRAKFESRNRGTLLLQALLMPMLLHGTFDALLMVPENMEEGAGVVSTVLFVVFIWFDIRLWKVGARRLRELQELSAQQAHGEANGKDDFSKNKRDDDSDLGGGDAFKGFDWNV